MVSSYNISGMTCTGCTQIVHDSILKVSGVKKVKVDLSKAQASIEMEYLIPIEILQTALTDSLYQISELVTTSTGKQSSIPLEDEESERNKELISSYVKAVGKLDHELLHQYLHPNFKYNGAVSYHSANDYVAMIKDHANSPVAEVLLEYDIKAIFTDENECCVIYDSVSRFPGKKVSFVEWIKIEDGKIASTNVKFNRHQMKQLMQELNKRKNQK
ncbi:MAG: cation transporter [Sphingobacteriaceae bacterium]